MFVKLAPPSVLRNRPESAATSTMLVFVGSIRTSRTFLAEASRTGALQVKPPSVVRTTPPPTEMLSKGSPSPTTIVLASVGLTSNAPTASAASPSPSAAQLGVAAEKLVVFQIPPPAAPMYTASAFPGRLRTVLTRPESTAGYGTALNSKRAPSGPTFTQAGTETAGAEVASRRRSTAPTCRAACAAVASPAPTYSSSAAARARGSVRMGFGSGDPLVPVKPGAATTGLLMSALAAIRVAATATQHSRICVRTARRP